MDPRDLALQSTMPTVMVPLFGKFEALATSGNRILNTKNGLWIEARRPGIYSRQPIAIQDMVAMPYGEVTPALETSFSRLGQPLREFAEMARKACPKEVGMALVWNEVTGKLASRVLEPIHNSSGHIHYKRPDLMEGEHVVVDFHSHGEAPAYFSRTDNKDDRGDLKIAVVVGNVNSANPTVKARACTLGHFLPLPISYENGGRDNQGETNVSAYASW